MRRLLFILFFSPLIVYSQYNADCFKLKQGRGTTNIETRMSVTEDTLINLNVNGTISGFSVSGIVCLQDDDTGFVRIILQDDYDYEYLVYEDYSLLNDSDVISFVNTGIESLYLADISPRKLKIEIKNASLQLSSFSFSTTQLSSINQQQTASITNEQATFIVNKLNENLIKHNMTWRAKITAVSTLTYEEKKSMYGGKVPQTYGFEHYAAGYFVMPSSKPSSDSLNSSRLSNQYVEEWDWRNRHGKNWMTRSKDQDTCGVCWSFAAIGAIEAYTNLFYNDTIHLDLSEQELVSCISGKNCSSGGFAGSDGFAYIVQNGVVNEDCFSYTKTVSSCGQKCQDPAEKVYMEGYCSIMHAEDSLKSRLFKSPVIIGLVEPAHEMVLAGYKIVHDGDSIYIDSLNPTYTINAPNPIIGKTAWLVKNSWGDGWGINGFGFFVTDISNVKINSLCSPYGRVTRIGHTDNEIVCEDADGDGYYFWGIGERPSHCPSWAPETPDGDDSNINFGPMDFWGYLEELPYGITIDDERYFFHDATDTTRYGIVDGGIYSISACMTMMGDAHIRVCEGGTLIVDGGSIINANIELVPGSTLIVRDGGSITMASGKQLDVPVGATMIIEEGTIN